MAKPKRRRRRQRPIQFRSGDIVQAEIAGVPGKHICIILKDESASGHQECLPVCNFTGSEVSAGEYAIDVSKYDLPDEWFGNKKPDSWVRCNEIDCVWGTNIENAERLGNIRDKYSELWEDVCRATVNCPISSRLQNTCDCEYEEIQLQIEEGEISDFDCGCDT